MSVVRIGRSGLRDMAKPFVPPWGLAVRLSRRTHMYSLSKIGRPMRLFVCAGATSLWKTPPGSPPIATVTIHS